MGNRSKQIGKQQSKQVAKLKKQAKRDGIIFVGRATEPHGKKVQMRKQMEEYNRRMTEAHMMEKAKRIQDRNDEDTSN